ncbi:MFS transporter [Streptomyces sp. NPDC048639]|uniref:MFS transporter n=1 Tax=Streptomyces sp. NPDC048639 TaxID=3365581 RepID=UPI0037161A53
MELDSSRAQLSDREIMKALTGLLLALFSSVSSTMIVTNALPSIVADLGGDQAQYTWLVAASLLTMTVSTPLWGRFADQFDKRKLVQVALALFVAGSMAAGTAQSIGMLIGMRAVQGVAMGGLLVTTQAIVGSIAPPRQGGRYGGYVATVMALGTLCGPLIGGAIVDTEQLGWRWCFFVVVPFAVASLLILHRHLRVPGVRRRTEVDYSGAVLTTLTALVPSMWVTTAGRAYPWLSWHSAAFLAGTLLSGALLRHVERRHPEAVVPPSVTRDRTTALAIVGSVAVGMVMFSSIVFLSQYFQMARGYSPTEAGLLGMPMMVGTAAGTLGSGHLITRFGHWKVFLVGGSALLAAGFALLGLLGHGPPTSYVVAATILVGLGIGAVLQNYVLVVQNTMRADRVGAGSASISFFRSLGGVTGVSLLGAIVTHRVAGVEGRGLPARDTYADAIGTVFAVSAGLALVSLLASLAIKPVPLRGTHDPLDRAAPAGGHQPGPLRRIPGTKAGRIRMDQPDDPKERT